jgi:phosphate transport system protein
LHIAQELERIADYGADIAKIVLELDMQPLADELQPLEQMVSDCTEMLQQVLDAYHAGDQVAARAAAARDSALDALESGVVAHIMERMSSTPKSISRCTRLLWIGHHLERIGDRVTNIAERVVFMITGETPDLDRRH